MEIKINNVAEYAKNIKYIVARYSNNEFWFWGAWDDEEKARHAAENIGGMVFTNNQYKECVA